MDVWVLLRTTNRKTHSCHLVGETDQDTHADHIGDVVAWRTFGPTDPVPEGSADFFSPHEMTRFFCIKIVGIPTQAAKKLKKRHKHEVLSVQLAIPRSYRLCKEVKKAKALTWLKNHYSAAARNFQSYFNNDTLQPYDEIINAPWSVVRDKVWDTLNDRLATAKEMEA